MYKAMFAIAYYGLMRVGKLTADLGAGRLSHAVKAKNVHVAGNKRKMMIMLYSSKTHGKESRPQKIKITAANEELYAKNSKSFFCPFELVRTYLRLRGTYDEDSEEFFVFRTRMPVQPTHARQVLKLCLKHIGLDETLYDFHSMRAGRAVDLIKKYNFSISEVKRLGRWKSNAVYRYIKM